MDYILRPFYVFYLYSKGERMLHLFKNFVQNHKRERGLSYQLYLKHCNKLCNLYCTSYNMYLWPGMGSAISYDYLNVWKKTELSKIYAGLVMLDMDKLSSRYVPFPSCPSVAVKILG
jgi:hypothetical protein